MKKPLLLASLLLSSAVQAETFVCDTEVNADLGSVNMLYHEPELQDQYVIDTEKGTLIKTAMSSKRIINPESKGYACNTENDLVICIEDDKLFGPNPLNRFVIQTRGKINFSYTIISLLGYANISSSLGSCTEI
ncbi:hypothetical protein N9D35_02190 [Gammaproteobacteria bacterium]|nr:hypothetical protein [Gammaproteobacteria bacterium]